MGSQSGQTACRIRGNDRGGVEACNLCGDVAPRFAEALPRLLETMGCRGGGNNGGGDGKGGRDGDGGGGE